MIFFIKIKTLQIKEKFINFIRGTVIITEYFNKTGYDKG